MLIIYLYEKRGRKNKKLLISALLIVLIIISIISWENIYSMFPITASIIMLFAFLLDNEKNIRIIGVISNILWTIYGIIYRSYSAMIFEVFSVIGTLIAVYKNRDNNIKKV